MLITKRTCWQFEVLVLSAKRMLPAFAAVVAGVNCIVTAGNAQSGPSVGLPVASWNPYLVANSVPILLPTTSAPIFGSAFVQTAPAEIAASLSALPSGATSGIIANAGTDVAGNRYQLLFVSGAQLFSSVISKTSPTGAVSYIELHLPGRPGTFVRTNTAFYLTYSSASYPSVYRLNPDGTLTMVISGPSVSYHLASFFAPMIDENDNVTYTVVEPAVGAGNIGARNIFAAVGAVPYIQPGFNGATTVPFAPNPTLNLSAKVYSSLPISYQWSYNAAPISGATQSVYAGPFLGAGTYAVAATTSGGRVETSTHVQLTVGGVVVGAAPTFLASPVGAQILLGSSLNLKATAAAVTPVSLQWALNGTPIPGASTTTPSTSDYGAYESTLNVTQPGMYTAIATTTGPGGSTVTSSGANVQVLTATGISVFQTPTIVAQPASVNTLYAGGVVTPAGLSVAAVATLPMSYQWFLNGTAIPGATDPTCSTTSPGSYAVTVSTTAGTTTSQAATVTVVTSTGVTVTAAPTITAPPPNVEITFGGSAEMPTLAVAAVALRAMRYQWFLNDVAIAGATAPTYKTATVGSYAVSVSTDAGSVTSAPAVVAMVNRLANTAGRCQIGAGANVGIAGFVVSSYTGAAKQILIRGVGSGLAQYGLAGVLAQPILSVFDATGRLVARNAGWGGSLDIGAAGMTAGAFPLSSGSADAALLLSLPPGSYTAQVAGLGGTTGIALAEIFEVVPDAGRLANISTRAFVGSGSGILIGGFVTSGARPSTVLVRAVGPGLLQFGLTGVLTQPVLSVYDSTGKLIGVNTGWSAGGSAEAVAINNAASRVGAFLLQPGTNDCAVLLALPPGSYTAQVSGANGSTGIALAEVYQIPP